MKGLLFEDRRPFPASAPNRMDIACFVGFVAVRQQVTLPYSIELWLKEQGWSAGPYARPENVANLLDIPVLIDNWDTFDSLFAWEDRGFGQPVDSATMDSSSQSSRYQGSTYLGAAVRSYFAQGGHRAYVVRVGDPWALSTRHAERILGLNRLIPGYPIDVESTPVDPSSWHGVGHIFGLPDVSFLCIPDLPDAVASDPEPIPPPPPLPIPPEQFVECSDPVAPPPPDLSLRTVLAPRCDKQGYSEWSRAVNLTAGMLAATRQGVYAAREVQLIAALPMPEGDGIGGKDLVEFLTGSNGPLTTPIQGSSTALATAFLQLTYPWVGTERSASLPEGLESPDGVLAGVLAQNALTRGTFRTAANTPITSLHDVYPLVPRHQIDALSDRISFIGPTPNGLCLLSDVTTSLDLSYQPANVNRLVSTISRAARRIGEDAVFEVSGEQVWSQVRSRLDDLLNALFAAGAFRGSGPAEAFQVRCDRSTMSQNDLDNGRLIAIVQFEAAAPIDTITVCLVVNEASQGSLLGMGVA
jgi:hypothetical protein